MRSANIQFHALPEEIIEFVTDAVEKYSVQAELERWTSKTVRTLSSAEDILKEVSEGGVPDRIYLKLKSARMSPSDRVVLNIGKVRDARLQQSQFSFEITCPEAEQAAKALRSDLQRRTKSGIWVTTETGNTSFVKSFRISPAAARAWREGALKLVSMAFTQSFNVDPA